MKALGQFLSFSKGLLAEPENRFREMAGGRTNPALPASVYIVYSLANSFFLKAKPPDFPAEFAQLGIGEKSLAFYFFAQIWGGALVTAAFSALVLFFLKNSGAGKRTVKSLCIAAAATACGLIALAAGTRPACLAASAAALLLIAAVIRRERSAYWRFFQAGLALSAAAAAVLPLEFAAVYLRAENFFIAVETALGLWMLALFAKMARIFAGAGVPRAALSLAAALLALVLFICLLSGAGLISKETCLLLFIL